MDEPSGEERVMCEGEGRFVCVLGKRVAMKEGGKIEGERTEGVCTEEERVVGASVVVDRKEPEKAGGG